MADSGIKTFIKAIYLSESLPKSLLGFLKCYTKITLPDCNGMIKHRISSIDAKIMILDIPVDNYPAYQFFYQVSLPYDYVNNNNKNEVNCGHLKFGLNKDVNKHNLILLNGNTIKLS